MKHRHVAWQVAALTVAVISLGCAPDLTPPAATQEPIALRRAVEADTAHNRYIIVLKGDISQPDQLIDELSKNATQVFARYRHGLKGFAAELPPAAIDGIRHNRHVWFVEKDRPAYTDGIDYSPGWALDRIDSRARVYDGQYQYDYDGTGVNIYVVDGGVDTSHPDFGGRARGAWSWSAEHSPWNDCNGHGTAVASAAAGAEYGSAKGANIWSVRANGCGDWNWTSAWLSAIDWVTGNHVKPAVMNFSVSVANTVDQLLPGSMSEAVKRAKAAGVVVVVSAGNDGASACDRSPSRVREVITVAASNSLDQRASFSSLGDCVDLFAPGEHVAVAMNGGGYTTMSGTSFSAPLVAGVAARLLQRWPSDTPDLIALMIVEGASINRLDWSGLGTGSPNALVYSTLPGPVQLGYEFGPTTVGYADQWCSWRATATGGRRPYTFQISGTLSANGDGVSGPIPPPSGSLTFRVTDALGATDETSLGIWVDPYVSNYCGV